MEFVFSYQKIPIFMYFWRSGSGNFLSVYGHLVFLWPFGIFMAIWYFYGRLVYVMVIWYILVCYSPFWYVEPWNIWQPFPSTTLLQFFKALDNIWFFTPFEERLFRASRLLFEKMQCRRLLFEKCRRLLFDINVDDQLFILWLCFYHVY
jgi:hypothetical protein